MKKILFSIFLTITLLSCENKITEKSKNIVLNDETANKVNNQSQDYPQEDNPEPRKLFDDKYSFVVFEGESFFSHEGKKRVVTGVFETKAYMDKNEEYKVMDLAQQKTMVNLDLRHIDKRYIQNFESYAEASQERERLLGINQPEIKKNNYKKSQADENYFEIDTTAYFQN